MGKKVFYEIAQGFDLGYAKYILISSKHRYNKVYNVHNYFAISFY